MKRSIKRIVAFIAIIVGASAKGISVRDNAQDTIHECRRPCIDPAEGIIDSRTCFYRFVVSKTTHGGWSYDNDDEESFTEHVINGSSPGPPIEICLGDTLVVTIENKLSSEELSFHWHGLRQKGSPHMDGVPMISQCPIMPYTSFRYVMRPENSGTFFYYAHEVRQQGDGLYGSLTVRGPRDDPRFERTLLVSAKPSSPLSRLVYRNPPVPRALILNGQPRDVDIYVEQGRKYLIRLVNANVFQCPIVFSLSHHDLDVKTNDGHAVEEGSRADRIIIFPGERFDVSIEANQTSGRYLIGIQGLGECDGLMHEAFLIYYKDNEDENEIEDAVVVDFNKPIIHHRDYASGIGIVSSLDLKGRSSKDFAVTTAATLYVPFDVNSYETVNDEMTDYSFNIYDFSYYPPYLSTRINGTRICQINRMTFEYPPSPILSQPESVPEETLCDIEKRAKICSDDTNTFCQCTQILKIPPWETVDIVLIDEGFGGNVSHTFHVHGYDAQVVGIGQFDRGIKMDEIVRMEEEGRLLRNKLHQRLFKNVFVVPNKGYIILRITTDNIGYWLWEARKTTGLKDDGPSMQFVMLVGNRESLPIVPIDFPTCGSHKGPASIFEDAD